MSLTKKIYSKTKLFPVEEKYGLTSQFRRAAISICANISEGCGSNSNKNFARYLSMSIGSLLECENYLILSNELNYVEYVCFEKLSKEIQEIKKMLRVFHQKLY